MARLLEDSGRYISQESIQKRRKVLAMALFVTAASFSFLGFLVGHLIRKSPLWTHAVCAIAFLVLLRIVFIRLRDNLERIEGAKDKTPKPEVMEGIMGQTVRELPEDFEIIAALTTRFGKLEQVIVGPVGVFLLETKNWKGVVSTDGKGELLWNGHPTDRPFVQEFEEKLSKIREELSRLAPGLDLHIKGLFVFTSAGIDAHLTNGSDVRFVRGDQLSSHILETKPQQTLTAQQVDAVARAFMSMAQVEAEGTSKELAKEDPSSPVRS